MPTAPLTLLETAARVGHYAWIEERLYAITGSWVQDSPEPEVMLFLAEQSRRHAWHAELWHARLPVLRDLDPAALTVPPTGAAPLFDALAATAGSAERLGALCTVVLPALLADYLDHRELATEVADAAVIRTLGFVAADEDEEIRSGLAHLEGVAAGAQGEERIRLLLRSDGRILGA